jgi:hypothetical protein
MTEHTPDRPVLSFDGRGINGPTKYRERVATFASDKVAKEWGPLFAAAPKLLTELELLLADVEGEHAGEAAYGIPITDPEHPWHERVMRARAAIAKAKGQTDD